MMPSAGRCLNCRARPDPAVDIARTFPFDAVSDAYCAQAQGANFGKIVIVFDLAATRV